MPKHAPLPPEEEQADFQRRAKEGNEQWLQRHHKVVAPLLIIIALAVFVLPWVFFCFATALGIQAAGIGILYMLGRKFTNAFHDRRIF